LRTDVELCHSPLESGSISSMYSTETRECSVDGMPRAHIIGINIVFWLTRFKHAKAKLNSRYTHSTHVP
jgi:hypothetical protein